MHNSFFRRKLAHRLRNCAVRRHAACNGHPSGEDLKIILLLDRLARDTDHLPEPLIDTVGRLCAEPNFARRFDRVWDTLADVLGVFAVPASASELVAWMIAQARHDTGTGTPATGDAAGPMGSAQFLQGPGRVAPSGEGALGSVAHDFTAAFAVVGPMLFIWEIATALAQWRDQAFVASHPATSATVVSAASEAGRGLLGPVREVLAFVPPGETTPCRVAVHLGVGRPDRPGHTLQVVPRSGACEPPLVPDAIGDPVGSVVVGLAFLAGGLVSLRGWTWLQRRRPTPRPARTRAAALRVALRGR